MAEPFLIDTHTHVNFEAFREDRKEVLARSKEAGVWLVNIGTQYTTSAEAVDLADGFREGVYAAVGLHPVHLTPGHEDADEAKYASGEDSFVTDAYRELARDPKVVGIGECGLDFYRLPEEQEEAAKATQREAFLAQIALAEELGKALIVHTRDAYTEALALLAARKPRVRSIVIHSFTGSREEAQGFLDLGCVIGFNGVITYKPRKERKPGSSDPGLLEAVKAIPLDRIVLETDAPYLAPDPHRGGRNEPAFVKHVAEALAALKGVSLEEVARATTKTAREAYGI